MIDIGEILDLVDHLVETHGEDHMAVACYVSAKQPNCMVGKILHMLGVPVYRLESLRGMHFENIPTDVLGLDFTYGARMALIHLQEAQDHGTWGDARDAAYKVARGLLEVAPDSLFVTRELALV